MTKNTGQEHILQKDMALKVFPQKWASSRRLLSQNKDHASLERIAHGSKADVAARMHEVHQASLHIYPDAIDDAITCQHCRNNPSVCQMFDERHHNSYVDLCSDCAKKELQRQVAGPMQCHVCKIRKTTSEMSNIVTAPAAGLCSLVAKPKGGLRVFLTDDGNKSWIPGSITRVNLAGFLPDMFSESDPETYNVTVDDGGRYLRVHPPFLRWFGKAPICTECRPNAKAEQQDLISRTVIQKRKSFAKRMLSSRVVATTTVNFSRQSRLGSFSRKTRLVDPNGEDMSAVNKRRATAFVVFLIGFGLLLGGAIPFEAERALRERVVSKPCNITRIVVEEIACLGDGDGVMIDVTGKYVKENDASAEGSSRIRRQLRRNRPKSEGCTQSFRITVGAEYFREDQQRAISSGLMSCATEECVVDTLKTAKWAMGSRVQCMTDPEDSDGKLVLVFESVVGSMVLLIVGTVLLVGDLVGIALLLMFPR